MKLAILSVAILLAACSSTPADSNPDQLYAVNGEACPAGSVRPEMPVSYSGLTDAGCRTKSDCCA